MRIRPSYHLAGASPLPLDVGYLLTAAPAAAQLLLWCLPSFWGFSDLGHGVSPQGPEGQGFWVQQTWVWLGAADVDVA